eukprot:comp22525_c0_seq3/m.56675 comp22525_c0_seq3/g.56675  ORF comp22525_c0_seq3/g.56675 comp22525_c0_seq3/m.56675 type:complete len:391 (-) comp22525_c0_seq3:157-1329(-)
MCAVASHPQCCHDIVSPKRAAICRAVQCGQYLARRAEHEHKPQIGPCEHQLVTKRKCLSRLAVSHALPQCCDSSNQRRGDHDAHWQKARKCKWRKEPVPSALGTLETFELQRCALFGPSEYRANRIGKRNVETARQRCKHLEMQHQRAEQPRPHRVALAEHLGTQQDLHQDRHGRQQPERERLARRMALQTRPARSVVALGALGAQSRLVARRAQLAVAEVHICDAADIRFVIHQRWLHICPKHIAWIRRSIAGTRHNSKGRQPARRVDLEHGPACCCSHVTVAALACSHGAHLAASAVGLAKVAVQACAESVLVLLWVPHEPECCCLADHQCRDTECLAMRLDDERVCWGRSRVLRKSTAEIARAAQISISEPQPRHWESEIRGSRFIS